MEVTNNTTTTVDAYQSTYGLQNSGSVASSSSVNTQPTDSVQLSATASVAAMHSDGMTVNQIAASSGLTTAEVDSYLGISTSATAGGGGAPVGGGHAAAKGGESHAASSSGTSSSTVAQTKKAAA